MLELKPITLRKANAYVKAHHRHSKPVKGCVCCVSVIDEAGVLRGVAIMGRPVARMADDGYTAEVTRVCTDGAPNACSMLYGACRRVAKALGYRLVITYTLKEEDGASLRGAGWRCVADVAAGSWSRDDRPREPRELELFPKRRWEVQCG